MAPALAAGLLVTALLASGCATARERDAAALRGAAETEATALLARVPIYADPALAIYLARLGARLAPPRAAPAIRFEVLRDPALNAFALPDGRIFVHTGLLAAVANEAQLATILAREIAHAAHRHAAGTAPAASLEGGALSRTAGVILGQRLPLSGAAAITGHGAADEREADAAAFARLVVAGHDPREAPKAFARLAAEAGPRGAVEVFLLGNRAWLAERQASMSRLLEATPVTRAAPDSEEFERAHPPLMRDNAADDLRLGRFELAQHHLEVVVATTPRDPLVHLYMGDLYRLESQRAAAPGERRAGAVRARAAYDRVIMLDPALAAPHRELGLLYYAEKDMAAARAAFRTYLELAPNAPDAPRIAEYLSELGR